MANRYWVGGTATWDTTAGTKWSTTSGGGGGSAVPTSSDDVFFDANSGAVTVTTGSSTYSICNSINFTGFTGTISVGTFPTIRVNGSVTCGSGMTWGDGTNMWLEGTATGKTLTTNGVAMCGIGKYDTGDITLQDTFTQKTTGTNLSFIVDAGTLNTNGQTVTVFQVYISSTNTRTLNITNSTINITRSTAGNGFDASTITGLTFTSTGSTIKMNGANAILRGSLTYNNIEINSSNTLTGTMTINDLKIGPGAVASFTISQTKTVTTFTSGGTVGNIATIQSTSAGAAFTLSDSAGSNTVSYMSIKDSTASGATWNADYTCTNVSGNTGWNFLPRTSTNFIPFL